MAPRGRATAAPAGWVATQPADPAGLRRRVPLAPHAVLLAEHQPEVAELARRYLARAGFQVRVAADPDQATAALTQRSAAVAVLDLTMPGLDARRLRRLLAEPRHRDSSHREGGRRDNGHREGGHCEGGHHESGDARQRYARGQRGLQGQRDAQSQRDLRGQRDLQGQRDAQGQRDLQGQQAVQGQQAAHAQRHPSGRMPAVFLLGNGMRPRDLRVSADSCLTRPFSPRLLVAKVQAAVSRPADTPRGRRYAGAAGTGLPRRTVGALTLDPAAGRVSSGSRDVALTPTEFALLATLAEQPGRVMSRDRLLAALGDRNASGRAVDVYVAQLRAKLGGTGAIRTVRGVGYALGLSALDGSLPDAPSSVGPGAGG